MIEWKAILEYRRYAEGDTCGFLHEYDGKLVIVHNDKYYLCPEEETTESFLDRIQRSTELKRNLFYEEWIKVGAPENDVWY